MMPAPCWRNPDVFCQCRGGIERARCDEGFVGEDDEEYAHDEDEVDNGD